MERNTRNESQLAKTCMKRIVVLALAGVLATFCFAALAETKPTDQKWLEAVQEMVTKGQSKVSTPSEERVNLLKAWGKDHGYIVKVTKTDAGYKIEVTKELAQK